MHHLTHKVNRASNEKGMLGMWEIWSDITSASPNGNSKSPVGTSCTREQRWEGEEGGEGGERMRKVSG